MGNYDSKLAGILGTVMIHLIAAVIFMSFKLQSVIKETSDNIIVEFAGEEDKQPLIDESTISLPSASLEKIFQNDPEILNIARNLAKRSDIKINPEDYIDQVKEELIKSGKLGPDNFIDEQKLPEEQEEDRLSFSDNKAEEKNKNLPENSEEMAANYRGPTRIYYDLPGRNHTYLPLPIYKCEGSGKVALAIEVDQRGRITSAKIIASQSSTAEPCLTETAIKTAFMSRFNTDLNASKLQSGTLTYHFVAQ